MSSENPFAALIDDLQDEINDSDAINKNVRTGEIIENIFGITLNKTTSRKQGYIYLKDLAETFPLEELNVEVLEHALFERLFIQNPTEHVLCDKQKVERNVVESRVITYLYNCYENVDERDDLNAHTKDVLKALILRNVVTALQQPDLYEDQKIFVQLLNVLKVAPEQFIENVYKEFLKEADGFESMKEPVREVLKLIHSELDKAAINVVDPSLCNLLETFSRHEPLAEIFLDYSTPKAPIKGGVDFANTLLGSLLNISILPKTATGGYTFFTNQMDATSVSGLENLLWSHVDKIASIMHAIFLNFLKSKPEIKLKTLKWLGSCLQANADRGKLWNSQVPDLNPANFSTVSDGFMMNLTNILLRLCLPFCANIKAGKMLKVDPTYAAVPDELCDELGVHLPDMSEVTCLIPFSTESEDGIEVDRTARRPTAASYNFLTDIFYMMHRSIDLGYRVLVDKLVKLNQDIGRIERAYNDAIAQANGLSDVQESIKERMKVEMSKYLSMKSVLSHPLQLNMMFDFISATAWWLTQVAAVDVNTADSFAPTVEQKVVFPLNNAIPVTLTCIPEFVVENMVCFLVFLRRYNPKVFEEQPYEKLECVLTVILVYMGSPERMKNPHLRARLAEALDALLPYHRDEQPEQSLGMSMHGSFQRRRLFEEYPYRKEIVRNLLSVFVGIEMTGQSVQFEQKFNYRRPMYAIMDYLWEIEEYRGYFKELAFEAEQNMEAMTPPLFLRFVNLLLNDAVFLLDEALSNMAQLREMQTARENGEWARLSMQERSQNESVLQHTGIIARIDNILGRETIQTLERLTSEITNVFTHSTMVDRVAAMLNYFLYNLVGPKKKNFKVKDQKEYRFDPGETVLNICKIYVHLRGCDAFCLAVSQDGRSYTPQLFALAMDVLPRIGGAGLIGELQEVASKVEEMVVKHQANEELIAEAPEHFLDPIMSTLMMDPVILPSSKQTVDRTTIARHLLSDQSDPFNRAPLTMEQVISNTELAQEIQMWLEERKNANE